MRQRNIQNYVFGAILVLLFLAVGRLFAPFFSVLLWSILLFLLLSPLHRRITKNINFETGKGKFFRTFWAGVFSIGTLVLILVPLSLIVTLFFKQMMDLGRYAIDLLNQRPEYLHDLFAKSCNFIVEISNGLIDISVESIENSIKDFITKTVLSGSSLTAGKNIIWGIGGFSFNMLLMAFSLFFFYVDGPYLAKLVLRAVPIRSEYITTLTAKFMEITRNLFSGYIIVALVQSLIAYIVYAVFRVQGSLVLAAITFILVFIPIIGGTLIYIPITIMKIANGNLAGALVFFFVCAIFISGTDNFLRPLFLKNRIHLHPLIIFFAILGGIIVFGFNGLILGPMIVIFFLTALDIFLIEHKIGDQAPGIDEK